MALAISVIMTALRSLGMHTCEAYPGHYAGVRYVFLLVFRCTAGANALPTVAAQSNPFVKRTEW